MNREVKLAAGSPRLIHRPKESDGGRRVGSGAKREALKHRDKARQSIGVQGPESDAERRREQADGEQREPARDGEVQNPRLAGAGGASGSHVCVVVSGAGELIEECLPFGRVRDGGWFSLACAAG